MKTKSWCFKAVLKAKFIQGVSLALYQNLDGGSEYLEAWFTGNGPRFHTRVHLAMFFPLLFPLWGRKLKPLENAWSPWISCCLYEPSTLTLLRTTLSRSPPASFPVPSTQRTCVFFLQFSHQARVGFLSSSGRKEWAVFHFPLPHFRQIYRDAQVHGFAKSWTWLSNRARTTRWTANTIFQFCSSNPKLRPILLPS